MQETMVDNAIAVISHGVAVERLSKIRSMDFDQATTGGTFVDGPSELTDSDTFGPGHDTENDDVDDFHGATVEVKRAIGGADLRFSVSSFVNYADEDDPSRDATGHTKTRYKKVTVQVYSMDVSQPDTIAVSQTISCKNACNWTSS